MADAPRFYAFWERVQGRSVFTMPRYEWEAVSAQFDRPVVLDITRTPLAQVASQASVVAAVAQQLSSLSAHTSSMTR